MNKEEKILDIRAEILNSYTSGTKWVTEIDALLSSYRDAVEEVSKLSQHDVIKNEVAVCGKCKVPSTGLDVGVGKCLNCDKEL